MTEDGIHGKISKCLSFHGPVIFIISTRFITWWSGGHVRSYTYTFKIYDLELNQEVSKTSSNAYLKSHTKDFPALDLLFWVRAKHYIGTYMYINRMATSAEVVKQYIPLSRYYYVLTDH